MSNSHPAAGKCAPRKLLHVTFDNISVARNTCDKSFSCGLYFFFSIKFFPSDRARNSDVWLFTNQATFTSSSTSHRSNYLMFYVIWMMCVRGREFQCFPSGNGRQMRNASNDLRMTLRVSRGKVIVAAVDCTGKWRNAAISGPFGAPK